MEPLAGSQKPACDLGDSDFSGVPPDLPTAVSGFAVLAVGSPPSAISQWNPPRHRGQLWPAPPGAGDGIPAQNGWFSAVSAARPVPGADAQALMQLEVPRREGSRNAPAAPHTESDPSS